MNFFFFKINMNILLYRPSKKRHFLWVFLDQTLPSSQLKVTPIVLEFALCIRVPTCTTPFADIYTLLKGTKAQALLVLNDKCMSFVIYITLVFEARF